MPQYPETIPENNTPIKEHYVEMWSNTLKHYPFYTTTLGDPYFIAGTTIFINQDGEWITKNITDSL